MMPETPETHEPVLETQQQTRSSRLELEQDSANSQLRSEWVADERVKSPG